MRRITKIRRNASFKKRSIDISITDCDHQKRVKEKDKKTKKTNINHKSKSHRSVNHLSMNVAFDKFIENEFLRINEKNNLKKTIRVNEVEAELSKD